MRRDEEELPSELKLQISRKKIIKFCQKWKIKELSFFGSVLRNDFHSNSDVDVLVAFEQSAGWTLFEHVQMQDELSLIFGRTVDLVSKRAIEKSHNWIRRKNILESAKVYYAT